ncbi:nitrilase-related carbon-nitrogen hydrolase [Microbacterium sp. ZW T6_19]|uniref:nitrilase-related carbon-nitrogen hydrolase n=1 Tax=Microbacterium sp. ZW T6_19 TaxID=3378082 RepID=UPI003853E84F
MAAGMVGLGSTDSAAASFRGVASSGLPQSSVKPDPSKSTFKVAAVQAEPVWFDMDKTVEKTIALMATAAQNGADIIAFPETWLPGYPSFMWFGDKAYRAPFIKRYLNASPVAGGPQHRELEKAAKRLKIHVVLGLSERKGNRMYMGMWVIDDKGKTILKRRKAKPSGREWDIFTSGDGDDFTVVPSKVGRIGALSCNENRRPLARDAMYTQNEQIHVAAWPHFGLLPDVWQMSAITSMESSAQYAGEGGVLTLAPSTIATAPYIASLNLSAADRASLLPGGGSTRIFLPSGEPVSDGPDLAPDVEGIVYATVDRATVVHAQTGYDAKPFKIPANGKRP